MKQLVNTGSKEKLPVDSLVSYLDDSSSGSIPTLPLGCDDDAKCDSEPPVAAKLVPFLILSACQGDARRGHWTESK